MPTRCIEWGKPSRYDVHESSSDCFVMSTWFVPKGASVFRQPPMTVSGVFCKGVVLLTSTVTCRVDRFSGEADKAALLRFWAENDEAGLDDKYAWIYKGNPAGRAVVFLLRADGDVDSVYGF